MQKNTQLKVLVFIFFVIILGLWLYVNGKLDRFNFSFGADITNIAVQINKSVSDIKSDSNVSQISKGIEAAKDLIKQEVSTTTEVTTSTDDMSADIAEKIIEKINNSSTTQESLVNYKYDPWKIEFVYSSGAKKIVDEKNQIISLTYGEDSGAYIYYKELKEENFGQWLAKSFNLDELDKEIIGGSTFWVRSYEGSGFKSRAYYTNYDKSIFTITINYKQAVDENKLMGIVNSFKIIK